MTTVYQRITESMGKEKGDRYFYIELRRCWGVLSRSLLYFDFEITSRARCFKCDRVCMMKEDLLYMSQNRGRCRECRTSKAFWYSPTEKNNNWLWKPIQREAILDALRAAEQMVVGFHYDDLSASPCKCCQRYAWDYSTILFLEDHEMCHECMDSDFNT
tara:strand:- start:1103 stop:1579 length:477 start_codon:yes stop_codon:yes gene_type:complete